MYTQAYKNLKAQIPDIIRLINSEGNLYTPRVQASEEVDVFLSDLKAYIIEVVDEHLFNKKNEQTAEETDIPLPDNGEAERHGLLYKKLDPGQWPAADTL